MPAPMKGAGERKCVLCGGCGKAPRDLGAYTILMRCPVCEGSGRVNFVESVPPPSRGIGRGRRAPTYNAALRSTSYREYLNRCREMGERPVLQYSYLAWRRAARARGEHVEGTTREEGQA